MSPHIAAMLAQVAAGEAAAGVEGALTAGAAVVAVSEAASDRVQFPGVPDDSRGLTAPPPEVARP